MNIQLVISQKEGNYFGEVFMGGEVPPQDLDVVLRGSTTPMAGENSPQAIAPVNRSLESHAKHKEIPAITWTGVD